MNLFSIINTLLDDSDLIKPDSEKKTSVIPPKKTYSNTNTEKKYEKKYEKYEKKIYPEKNSDQNKPPRQSTNCFGLYPVDGDTFVGMYDKQKTTFRLAGIDAPEKDENFAKESTEFLRQYIDKKVLFLEFKGKDKYDRHIVEVFTDKEKTKNVNKMLIENGLATSESYKNSDGDKTHGPIENISNEANEWKAKLTGKGMWS